MMYNNAKKSKGHVLVGGLGLGTYLQYAQVSAIGKADKFTIIEKSKIIAEMVFPTIAKALNVPFEIIIDNFETYLSKECHGKYDTVFIDTWETLDATKLPDINHLRNRAVIRLQKKGNVLLWGYRWMVRLFVDACMHIFLMDTDKRKEWITHQQKYALRVAKLLAPVVDHYAENNNDTFEEMLKWCLNYIISQTYI